MVANDCKRFPWQLSKECQEVAATLNVFFHVALHVREELQTLQSDNLRPFKAIH